MTASTAPITPFQPDRLLQTAAAIAAATVPTLLAYNQPPSATLMNQCVAVAMWGGLVLVLAPAWRTQGARALLAALAAMALGVLASFAFTGLPGSLALAAGGLLVSAAVMVLAGVHMACMRAPAAVFSAFAGGLLVAALASTVVAFIQVFVPGLLDGVFLAHSGLPGRAVGNLRQPNHLCSLLLLGVVACVALHQLGRLRTAEAAVLLVPMVFAVELSASRTGAAGLALLLLWGLLDRRLSRAGRVLLVLTPLLYALSYAAMAAYGALSHQALGAGARLAAEAGGIESPNSRLNIWRNALALIAQQPWTGVGFGEFNLAWTLTPFPGRPTAFFDHSHNLVLQLLAELGLPLGTLVLALMALALWQALRGVWRLDGADGVAGRSACALVLMIGLHSLVEYPLWYSYFLLPTALAWGFALALGQRGPSAGRAAPAAGPHAAGVLMGLALVLGGCAALLDYQRVVVIYAPLDNSGPLAERIAAGQRSPLFAHHADYAAVTSDATGHSRALGLRRAPHHLLDTRLMMAWANALAAQGELAKARTLADRLREFNNSDARAFFAVCEQPGAAQHFQCQPLPTGQAVPWRAFLDSGQPRRR